MCYVALYSKVGGTVLIFPSPEINRENVLVGVREEHATNTCTIVNHLKPCLVLISLKCEKRKILVFFIIFLDSHIFVLYTKEQEKNDISFNCGLLVLCL